MKKALLIVSMLTVIILFVVSCSKDSADGSSPEADNELIYQANQNLSAITANPVTSANNQLSDAKIRLGKILFFDKRLSLTNSISCSSCHNLSTYGVDNLPVSPGHTGQLGTRNAPTVFNAAYHFRQFWDGRVNTPEEQARVPILNPIEMALPDAVTVENKLGSLSLYQGLFAAAYPGEGNPVTFNNTTQAIGAFVRTLVTPSRFDSFLNGNTSALTTQEKNGLRTFIQIGCVSCHSGAAVGGSSFQKFGVYADYFEFTNSAVIDNGRFTQTGLESERYVFKVPSLRNAAQTYPYFHDGSVRNLEDAVSIMGRVNLNVNLSGQEVNDIVAFINSLTARVPESVAAIPEEL
ncbi:cytochrome c peroxidase [Mucilaginibacter sp. KACC 22773]|uniref:cytochrome-c peroxidase n=1 Tax=Mucilaginibacter sp. KACC 22773 TaxID=3025671 RepID=UPI002365FC16|nr:cytochrome c peroxidase [Mucilaginibacter sp. KACC 22773]WDF77232.1 cytochrome c peroxidase [Mucilaginibacter sp. KACC 22773]